MPAIIFNPMPIIYLTGVSIIFCLPMIALSIVNFGMLSIWLNATVAILILIHHFTFLAVAWRSRKHASSSKLAVIDDDESSSFIMDLEPPMAFSLLNVLCTSFLCIITALAFSVMVDITTRGASKSTLPVERIGSHKWNIKVQIAQTTVLGAELLTLMAALVFCAMGLKRFYDEKEKREAEFEYGAEIPVVSTS
jgi:hypothetical protein